MYSHETSFSRSKCYGDVNMLATCYGEVGDLSSVSTCQDGRYTCSHAKRMTVYLPEVMQMRHSETDR